MKAPGIVNKKALWILTLVFCICFGAALCGGALADTLTLPAGMKTVEEEAFSGDTSLDGWFCPKGWKASGQRRLREAA